ncbi:MAG: glycoside hydrolase family 78 protein [Prevotellaceae bacterium]|nr:glycoside hydrolase family 78 protein [Prevotellaceae bacterium]
MMKITGLISAIFLCMGADKSKPVSLHIDGLTCESAANPAGIETQKPAFGWQIRSEARNIMQAACRILVADSRDMLDADHANCWDSGKTYSDVSIWTPYDGIPLKSGKTYFWKVKIWDAGGNESPWSETAQWQMGLLNKDAWSGAQWIALQELPVDKKIVAGGANKYHKAMGKMENLLPCIRSEFVIADKPLKKATAFVSGLGHFEMNINGRKVGNHFLDPGWTEYDSHALYLTFDILSLLRRGANACGLQLGNGFHHTPHERYLKCVVSYGYPKAICKLLFEYQDGTTQEIVTDPSWKTASSPVTFSSIYGGEDYDARLKQRGWDMPGFDDSGWKNALPVGGPELRSQTATPVRITDTIAPVRVFQSRNGRWIYDLGQNFSGIASPTVDAAAGQSLKIFPGELLDDDSLVTQKASGSPFWFGYTSAGGKSETWQPQFTYYGFRYLMLEGAVPQDVPNPHRLPVITRINGLHIRNAAPQSGSFVCSSELFNRVFHLIDWSIRSNMMSVLTDCPHREKLGWLEVAHLMGTSIQYNYNVKLLFQKIIDDMRTGQQPNGLVPDIAPEYVVFKDGFRDSPEWGSAFIILPWYLRQWYGDLRPLQQNYAAMKRYADYLGSKTEGHILSHGLGDWYDLGPNHPGESQLTSKGVTATAVYYYDICILQKTAALLGYSADETHYRTLAEEIRTAFNRKYFNRETKQYDRNSQTANAMALYMGLADEQHRNDVFANIIADLKQRNYSQTPGDIGFRYFLRVLESEGASETIFTINSRDDVPGYGFQLAKGATSLTESWAALRFVSNNHCMLGHLMEWFYSGLAGIRQAEHSTAFRETIIHPNPVGNITSASATYQTPYGKILSEWEKDADSFRLHVEIPANTSALVYFPVDDLSKLTENGTPFKTTTITDAQGRRAIKIGSGVYRFGITIFD